MPSVIPALPPDIIAPGQAASVEGLESGCSNTIAGSCAMTLGSHGSASRERMLPSGESLYTISLGPVPKNSDCKMLCPMRLRAILPHQCDQRYGRDEYPSDVSDTDNEGTMYIGRKGKT